MNVLEWSLPIIATKTSQLFLHLLKMIEIDKQDETQNSSEQANVITKLQCLSNILESKKSVNLQLLLKNDNIEAKEGEE